MMTQPDNKAGKPRDVLFFNKLAGGVLFAGLVLWIAYHVAGAIVSRPESKNPILAPATAEVTTTASGALPPLNNFIIKADLTAGHAFFEQQCSACHSANRGGAAGVGPNLYGVMGSPMFSRAGYEFSTAAKRVARGHWTYQQMNEWLFDPQKFAPGTRMSYPGIKNNQQRANVIAYLRTLSAHPIPLPKPGPATEPRTASTLPTKEGVKAPSLSALYANADLHKGQNFFEQQCSACHTIAKGGANGVGPNLYGVVGAPMFAHEGYDFSDAAKKQAHGRWTPHKLNEWLYAPTKYVPGTRMGYSGIKNNQIRADVIAYLNAQSATPVKLP